MEWEPKREDKRNGNVVCFALAWMESKRKEMKFLFKEREAKRKSTNSIFSSRSAGEERLSLFIWACRGALGPLGRRFIHSTHAAFAQLIPWNSIELNFFHQFHNSLSSFHSFHSQTKRPTHSISFISFNQLLFWFQQLMMKWEIVGPLYSNRPTSTNQKLFNNFIVLIY